MASSANLGEIPIGMIHDHERLGRLREPVEQFGKVPCGADGVVRKRALGGVETRGRDAMDTQMKHRAVERHRPFQ